MLGLGMGNIRMEAMFENCPIKRDAEEAVQLGSETLKVMRRLRRRMRDCPECPDYDGCPVLAEFHAAVDEVVREIQEEWDLK
jgi:hypothetical protein